MKKQRCQLSQPIILHAYLKCLLINFFPQALNSSQLIQITIIFCVSVAHMFYHLLSSLHAKLQFLLKRKRNFLINERRHEKFMVNLCKVKWIKTFLFMFTKKRLFSLVVAVMQVNLWHFSDEQIISLFPLPP